MNNNPLTAKAHRLLAFIRSNPKMPLAEIAKRTGVPEATIILMCRQVKQQAIAKTMAQSVSVGGPLPNEDINNLVGTDFAPAYAPPGEFYTDHDQLMDDIAKAEAMPNAMASPSDLTTLANLSDIQEERRDADVRPVRITPKSVRKDSLLGNTVFVQSGGIAPSAVFWEGENDEAMEMCIALSPATDIGTFAAPSTVFTAGGAVASANVVTAAGVVGTSNLGVPIANIQGYPTRQNSVDGKKFSYRPYAKIRWGTRGALHTAYVDIGRGVQLKLSASAVYVDLGSDAAPAGQGAGIMALRGTIGFFGAGITPPVSRTVYIDNLGPGATQNIIVPPFAQELAPIQRASPGAQTDPAGVSLVFKDAGGNQLYIINVPNGSYMITPAPLSSDVYSIDVISLEGADTTTSIRAIFNLSL